MNSEEFQRFWTLLHNLFPASSRLKRENSKLVWEKAMEVYGLEAASNAAVAYARKHKFLPDISDLTAGLPSEAGEESGPEVSTCQSARMAGYVRALAEVADGIRAEYRARGQLSPLEAKLRGIPYRQWSEEVREGGA